jgi:mRNA-degrading endonuclease RelE of RelBE toxin-antitoxin system
MSYDIIAIPQFKKELKKLSKKYPSLKDEFSKLIKNLENDPEQGVALGKNCYKIRLAIASKGKGKSGGARVITHIVIAETTVYLMTIFDKADKETLSDKELKELLDFLPD